MHGRRRALTIVLSYMKLLEALEVKPELTDMGARRSRTRNVTTARRAKVSVVPVDIRLH